MEAVVERPIVRWPAGPDWTGMTAAILASGPSLSMEQVERVRGWRAAGGNRRVIVINTTFLLAPWADILYACDAKWWQVYLAEVRETFRGELWTQCSSTDKAGIAVCEARGLRWVARDGRQPGLSTRHGLIFTGTNSGHQAINLAWQTGATRLILLGYDMQMGAGARSHHHGDHPRPLLRVLTFGPWLGEFAVLARDCAAAGLDVVNCSPRSALRSFPVSSLDEALSHV